MAEKRILQTRASHTRNRVVVLSKNSYNRTRTFIQKRPMSAFLITLGLLLLVLILARVLQKNPSDQEAQAQTKAVQVYSIGQGPQATFQAQVQKSGVVQIVALAPGVVQNIPVKEGQAVSKGQTLVSLSNNYQGGTAASVQREIAQRQYQGALDTYQPQLDVISNQKDVATISAQNAQDLRDISKTAFDETGTLINANQAQLDQLKQQLTAVTAVNPNDPSIPGIQAQINQLQGGINQLNEAERSNGYQASDNNPPTLLSNLQEDITLKQLDVQEKSLAMNKDIAGLQENLAAINEALMYPASPFTGTVEKIDVKVGQVVSAGQVLATISSNTVTSHAVLLIPQPVAALLQQGEASYFIMNGERTAVTPYYVSSEATDGELFSAFYTIPDDIQKEVNDGDYINMSVPLGQSNTSATPLIPIDAVYQNQENAYVLVARNNHAETKIVTPGEVYGSFVEITKGLATGDQIILNRNVIAGDKIALH